MKFVVFVEGDTEHKVLGPLLKRWLDPRLDKPVGVRVVNLKGWSAYEKDIASKVRLNLSGKTGEDVIGAIGLLDLYGPTNYPSDKVTAAERKAWGRQHYEGIVNDKRFSQHFAVHETEAWLLADSSVFPVAVRTQLSAKASSPETVNFLEPPARLLSQTYRTKLQRDYKKVVDGADLFSKLNVDLARQKCPNLGELLDKMLQLAKDAGL